MLDGNVTLITGGGSGLGRAIVSRFIDEGAHVAVLELSADKATQLTADFGDAVSVIVGDVTSPEDNERAVAQTLSRFGKLDTFIGNAGLWDFNSALEAWPTAQLADAFDQLFSVNVKGYLLGARASVAALRESCGSMILRCRMLRFCLVAAAHCTWRQSTLVLVWYVNCRSNWSIQCASMPSPPVACRRICEGLSR